MKSSNKEGKTIGRESINTSKTNGFNEQGRQSQQSQLSRVVPEPAEAKAAGA